MKSSRSLSASSQAGAALAISLIILVILTLLGIAAMRASRLELRLSQNSESRMLALEAAQALADSVTNRSQQNLDISQGLGYNRCFISTANDTLPAPTDTSSINTFCANSTGVLSLPSGMTPGASYALVQRDLNSPEFVTVNALRGAGASGRSYDFARFTVTAGYDNSGNGQGAAEVIQGTLKLHAKPQGVNYQ